MLSQCLIPSKFDHCVDELSTVFRGDLPDLATWRLEITGWRMKFHDGFEHIPVPLQKSLNYTHEDSYPNIKRIFIILLTLTVTSVCCERSFSSLRRRKSLERATVGEDGLYGLAMLYVHRDTKLSRENILRRFDETDSKQPYSTVMCFHHCNKIFH
jgi:hypothetical protein